MSLVDLKNSSAFHEYRLSDNISCCPKSWVVKEHAMVNSFGTGAINWDCPEDLGLESFGREVGDEFNSKNTEFERTADGPGEIQQQVQIYVKDQE